VEETRARIVRGDLPAVSVEAIRMQQVFQNLIGNGLKYRRPDCVPEIRITAERRQGEWLFAVSDNGVGIPEEYRTVIFDAFRRLGTRAAPGTGLGLAICKRTVELNGGTIWVESRVGEGSTFFFTLPAKEDE
jgi:signal transduction histidine kinase